MLTEVVKLIKGKQFSVFSFWLPRAKLYWAYSF